MYLNIVEAFVVVVAIVVVTVVTLVVLLCVIKQMQFITLALTNLHVKETLILCSRDLYEEPKL